MKILNYVPSMHIYFALKPKNLYHAYHMIIIKQKQGESVERMLRRYKRKHKNLKLRREVQQKKYYTKPSAKRKMALEKAKYINRKRLEIEG
jgi:small subunit ribosomal protein S21